MKTTPKLTGKHEDTYDATPINTPYTRMPGARYVGHAFGVQICGSATVEFEDIYANQATITMLDEEPGGDTFSVLEGVELEDYNIEDEESFTPKIGIKAIFRLEELEVYIAGLQKLHTRMVNAKMREMFKVVPTEQL